MASFKMQLIPVPKLITLPGHPEPGNCEGGIHRRNSVSEIARLLTIPKNDGCIAASHQFFRKVRSNGTGPAGYE